MDNGGESIVGRRTIFIISMALLAGMVGLLWLTSGSVSTVSADGSTLSVECSLANSADCADSTLQAGPTAHGASQLGERGSVLLDASAGAPATGGGGQDESKCLLPWIPCFNS